MKPGASDGSGLFVFWWGVSGKEKLFRLANPPSARWSPSGGSMQIKLKFLLATILGFWLTPRVDAAPFRPSTLNFPLSVPATGPLRIVPAFSQLRFSQPLFLGFAPGLPDKIFLVEQSGRIKYFTNDAQSRETLVLADFSSVISTAGDEMGLLGLAFAPDFATSREFYVSYTAENPRRLEVARLRASVQAPLRADVTQREIVITVPKTNPRQNNHNGGMLAFGPDGYLYIGTGDGGGAGDQDSNAQNRSVLLGKMLRIDARGGRPYRIPADNPFVNIPNVRPEIWAWGLRNPWRFAFDAGTGALWLADVGQDAWEEINIIQRGQNYGWRIFEGNANHNNPDNLNPANFAAPLFAFPQRGNEPSGSITGGYVYRGTRIPNLQGAYIYGDYLSGRVWKLNTVGTEVRNEEITRGQSIPSLTSFGVDAAGEIYLISRNGNIFRLEAAPQDEPAVRIPRRLADTGIFADLATLRVNEGFESYEVNSPLWSDGAQKKRWIALPARGQINFRAAGNWEFPSGTLMVKHFELPMGPITKRLETRLLFKHAEGWRGYTYRWNAEGTDAELLEDGATEELRWTEGENRARRQVWNYPSRTSCLNCHVSSMGFALGTNTAQLNRADPQGRNQLRRWFEAGALDRDPGDTASLEAFAEITNAQANLQHRVKSYLHVNCAQCHNPQGVAPGQLDMRYSTALPQMNLVGIAPTQGNLGIADAQRIFAGDRRRSILFKRMESLDPQIRMPSLATSVADENALENIGAWIDSLPRP